MASYVMFGKYTIEGMKGISASRSEEARNLIRRHGGELRHAWALLGDIDLVLVVDLPDTARAMAASAALSRFTGIGFTTSPALSLEEFDPLMQH
jgi:uncharacterized protein with GYD domain